MDYTWDDCETDEVNSSSENSEECIDLAGLVYGMIEHHRFKKRWIEEMGKECEQGVDRDEYIREQEQKRQMDNKLEWARINNSKRIPVEYSSKSLIGKNVDDVVALLSGVGFQNIKKEAIKDIYTDTEFEVGEVEIVLLGNKSFFEGDDQLAYDKEITIKYHDKKEIRYPYNNSFFRNWNYKKVEERLFDKGFTSVRERPLFDLKKGWLKKPGAVQKIVDESNREIGDRISIPYDTKLIVVYHDLESNQYM